MKTKVRKLSRLSFAVPVVAVLLIADCRTPDAVQPGLVENPRDNGTIEIISIGKASPRAIKADNIAMKQTTSREAARLMLRAKIVELLGRAEIKGPYQGLRARHFEPLELSFLEAGKYCRIRGIFYPAGRPERPKQ